MLASIAAVRKTYEFDSANGLPRPCIEGQVPAGRFGIRALFQATFPFDSAARYDFHEVPFPFLCETLRESPRGFCFSWIELEGLLEALGCAVGVGWGNDFGIVDTQVSECGRKSRRTLQGRHEVLVCFLAVFRCRKQLVKTA